MKTLIFILLLLPIWTVAQTTPDGKNWRHTGNNEFTKQVIIQTKAVTGANITKYNNAVLELVDTTLLSQVGILKSDSAVNYVTPYQLSQLSSGVGFATYDSLATDSVYFNTLTHQLRARHGGWWYGFTPSDSAEIYVAPENNNLVIDGHFDNASDWDLGTGITLGSGVLMYTSQEFTMAIANVSNLSNTTSYSVTYTITRSAGAFRVILGGAYGTAREETGTFTETITTGASATIWLTSEYFVGTVDNLIIIEN